MLMEQAVPAARSARSSDHGCSSFAGAFAAVVLLVGLTVVQVDLFSPQRETSTTSDTFPVNTVTTEATSTTETPTTAADTLPITAPPETTSSTVAVDDIAPPSVITFPENGAKVTEKSLRFEGTTEPGAVVAAGPYQADVDQERSLVDRLAAQPGRQSGLLHGNRSGRQHG